MHNPVTGYILGELERMRGDYEHSAEMLRDSLGELRARSTETPLYEFYSAQSLATLGLTTMLLGDRAGATKLCLEGLESARRLGHQIAITVGLDVMAIILVELGKDKAAARLFGAADALRERTGMAVWEPLRRDADKARDQGHHRLGADGFASAYREGRSQPAERAVDAALKLRHELLSLPRA